MSAFFTRLALGLLWLIARLPYPAIRAIGRGLGSLFFVLVRPRRKVALTNLRLCFPAMTEGERVDLARRHFQALTRSVLERGILWWGSPERIRSLGRLEGWENFQRLLDAKAPIILLCPHFVSLDFAATRLAMEQEAASIYSNQKNPLVNRMLLKGRTRFKPLVLISRSESLRTILKVVRKGLPLFYLPDMDLGPQDSIFSPFFGVSAATVTALPRIAHLTGATVLPVIARATPEGIVIAIGKPWEDYPTGDLEADVGRMNAFIESQVSAMPEQYYWVHKRFKSRPPGEADVYGRHQK